MAKDSWEYQAAPRRDCGEGLLRMPGSPKKGFVMIIITDSYVLLGELSSPKKGLLGFTGNA